MHCSIDRDKKIYDFTDAKTIELVASSIDSNRK